MRSIDDFWMLLRRRSKTPLGPMDVSHVKWPPESHVLQECQTLCPAFLPTTGI